MKWFRRFRDVHWMPGDRPADSTADEVMRLWMASDAPRRQERNGAKEDRES
jgi:hypothetical protein